MIQKNPPERPEVEITPQHKDGKVKADKKVNKKDPKLGEEVEYRISFKKYGRKRKTSRSEN